MANVDLLEPFWPGGTAGVQRWPVNTAIAPGEMDSAPTAAVDYAGALIYVPGATGVADTLDVCLKNTADAYVLQSLSAPLARVVDTAGAFATPIVLTAADSGRVYLLDDAAGLDFTLPALTSANVGIQYRFIVQTTNTSNSYRFTAQAADLLTGGVWVVDTDAAYNSATRDAVFLKPDVSDDLIMDLTSDATGGMVGGSFEFLAISATRWFVSGTLAADGAITTMFS
jgi:hypothetical protein